jgi:hypothetical protein
VTFYDKIRADQSDDALLQCIKADQSNDALLQCIRADQSYDALLQGPYIRPFGHFNVLED